MLPWEPYSYQSHWCRTKHAGNILPDAVSMDLESGKEINIIPSTCKSIWNCVLIFWSPRMKSFWCHLIEFVELSHSLHRRVIPATISFEDLKMIKENHLAVPEYSLWMIADTFPKMLAYIRAEKFKLETLYKFNQKSKRS